MQFSPNCSQKFEFTLLLWLLHRHIYASGFKLMASSRAPHNQHHRTGFLFLLGLTCSPAIKSSKIAKAIFLLQYSHDLSVIFYELCEGSFLETFDVR